MQLSRLPSTPPNLPADLLGIMSQKNKADNPGQKHFLASGGCSNGAHKMCLEKAILLCPKCRCFKLQISRKQRSLKSQQTLDQNPNNATCAEWVSYCFEVSLCKRTASQKTDQKSHSPPLPECSSGT